MMKWTGWWLPRNLEPSLITLDDASYHSVLLEYCEYYWIHKFGLIHVAIHCSHRWIIIYYIVPVPLHEPHTHCHLVRKVLTQQILISDWCINTRSMLKTESSKLFNDIMVYIIHWWSCTLVREAVQEYLPYFLEYKTCSFPGKCCLKSACTSIIRQRRILSKIFPLKSRCTL
jgi:hypothetical protein